MTKIHWIRVIGCCFGLVALVSSKTDASAAETPESWYTAGAELIASRYEAAGLTPRARNIILFVGDGMSLTTVSAARILEGQQLGGTGEEHFLYFEQFPHVALSKTYNTNQQTPDSAGTMTAMATGVKSFAGAISVDARATRGDCASMNGAERASIIDLANVAGLATGIVTTTRITHATPAALYSKSVDRRWESDRGLPPSAIGHGCKDIATQLVEYEGAKHIDLIFGGGRRAFYPEDMPDPEYVGILGFRLDGKNLIDKWAEKHPDGHFIWNQQGFEALNGSTPGPLLALFEPDHMQYEYDRLNDQAGEPSLTEMVSKAVEILSTRSHNGYVLVVESGRIDHAHHANNAWRALTDTIELSRAIQTAVAQIDLEETLVIVTSDHAHALTFDGYGKRGNPIMGYAINPGRSEDEDGTMRDHLGQPMTVLNYANGPGFRRDDNSIDFRQMDQLDPDYKQNAGYWQYSATHAGEDVPIYSKGAGAEVLFGVIEQNALFHAMALAHPALRDAIGKLSGNLVTMPPFPVSEAMDAPAVHD